MDIIKIRTCYGGYVHVSKKELDSSRTLLRLYNSKGERVQGENTVIHRGNLDPDGSVTANNNRGTNIFGKGFDGYADAASVKREIRRLKQNPADYQVKKANGRWIGVFAGEVA